MALKERGRPRLDLLKGSKMFRLIATHSFNRPLDSKVCWPSERVCAYLLASISRRYCTTFGYHFLRGTYDIWSAVTRQDNCEPQPGQVHCRTFALLFYQPFSKQCCSSLFCEVYYRLHSNGTAYASGVQLESSFTHLRRLCFTIYSKAHRSITLLTSKLTRPR